MLVTQTNGKGMTCDLNVDGNGTNTTMSIGQAYQKDGLDIVFYEGSGKLKCRACDICCTSGTDVELHWRRMHDGRAEAWACGKCSKQFERLTQVSCHFPRCQRQRLCPDKIEGDLRFPGTKKCGFCEFSCESDRGLTQHQRTRHPEEHHKMLAAKDKVKRRGYENAELMILAETECKLPESTRFVNKALAEAGIVERSSEQIRQIRKTAAYRSLLTELKEKRARSVDDEPLCEEDSPEVPKTSLRDIIPLVGDRRYLEFFDCAEEGHAEGWPQSAVEKLDSVMKKLYREAFRVNRKKERRVKSKPSYSDWRSDKLGARERKYVRYRTCQRMWFYARKQLAKVILDDAPINPRPPAIRHVEEVYRSRFSLPRQLGELSTIDIRKGSENMRDLVDRIGPEEVSAVIDSLQPSACGPDGQSVIELKKVGAHALSLLFSCWLMARKTPHWTKRCRTILLPKTSVRTEEVGNWRPITIGPHLIRLYTKILARRLQGVVNLNPMQKAFREVDGCAEHIALLHGLIRDARERSRSIFVVFLDLAKAFDTVHHELVTRALRRQGCPEHFIEVVKDLYDGAVTRVSNGTSDTGEIEIRSGVKQGCPLSPLLFNLVMDELVDELDPRLGCRLSDGSRIATMAFADDLVLVSESLTGIKSLLGKAESFMESHALTINASKSYSMGLKKVGTRKQLRALTEPFLHVGKHLLPVIGPSGSTRYLGVNFGIGGIGKVTRRGFKDGLGRLVGSALKPRQKIECLRVFIWPRWQFRLALGRTTIALLSWLGREIRHCVRKILHAPGSLSKEWIHLEMRKGGLGIPDPLESTYLAKTRILERLRTSDDAAVRSIVSAGLWGGEADAMERHLCRNRGLDPTSRFASLSSFRWERWRKSTSGRGAELFIGKRQNFWLHGDGPLGPARGGLYVFASKLRTQTLP